MFCLIFFVPRLFFFFFPRCVCVFFKLICKINFTGGSERMTTRLSPSCRSVNFGVVAEMPHSPSFRHLHLSSSIKQIKNSITTTRMLTLQVEVNMIVTWILVFCFLKAMAIRLLFHSRLYFLCKPPSLR